MHKISSMTIIFFYVIISVPTQAVFSEAGVFSKAASKAAARKAATKKAVKVRSASTRKDYNKIEARDIARDNKTQAKPLEQNRTVYRYTSKENAKAAQKKGLHANSHMTSGVSKGRPLTSEKAQKRFGLENPPDTRLTIKIPKGHPVKKNKVIGGEAGWGEITSPKKIPAKQVIEVKPVNRRSVTTGVKKNVGVSQKSNPNIPVGYKIKGNTGIDRGAGWGESVHH